MGKPEIIFVASMSRGCVASSEQSVFEVLIHAGHSVKRSILRVPIMCTLAER